VQNRSGALRTDLAGSRSVGLAPGIGMGEHSPALFPDEDLAGGPTRPAAETDHFALFPDEDGPRLSPAGGRLEILTSSSRPPDERGGRTLVITPRLLLLALVLCTLAFGSVRSCQVAASAAPTLVR
jgi:hypothetical protein